ncbi:MAG: vitamin K epoxide reductase family protein [archaeon]
MDKKKIIFGVLLLIFLVNLLISIQIYSKVKDSEGFCLAGGDCMTVQTSQYAKTFGIPNTIFGMIAFGALALFFFYSFFKESKILTMLAKTDMILSSLAALWFIFVMAFILKDWCSSCLWVDITTILGTTTFFMLEKRL